MKKLVPILVSVIFILVIVGIVYYKNTFVIKQEDIGSLKIPNTGTTVTSKPLQNNDPAVPLPTDQDVLRSFFATIDEQRSSDAVTFLNPKIVATDSDKQAWTVQFNAFKSFKVKTIESSLQYAWTETNHTYKVIFVVEMKPESASAVIPYYGYNDGENTRWLTLEKVGKMWTISGLSTGP